MNEWVECVPNFSEGRDASVIAALRQAIETTSVKLLDQTFDRDHNRSVFTFAGRAAAVEQAVLRAAEVAVERIDLRRHEGVHPRIGALDVAPLVALGETTSEHCIDAAHRLGDKLWKQLRVPVYFYGEAARTRERVRLEKIRKIGFEALSLKVEAGKCLPDVGDARLHESAGATCIGVRGFLAAFNVELATDNLAIARQIARRVRESSGGLPGVKALGLSLVSRGTVQVSMNITDTDRTPLHQAVAAVAREAREKGVEVARGELIGLLPRKAAAATSAEDLYLESLDGRMIVEDLLGLD